MSSQVFLNIILLLHPQWHTFFFKAKATQMYAQFSSAHFLPCILDEKHQITNNSVSPFYNETRFLKFITACIVLSLTEGYVKLFEYFLF